MTPLIRDEEPSAPAPGRHPLAKRLEALAAALQESVERLSGKVSELQGRLDLFIAMLGETFRGVAEVVSRNVSRGKSAALWKDPTLWACVFRGELAPIPVDAPRACPIAMRVAASHRTGWPAR